MSKYSELIKNYEKIREYMRDFYIYGFRSREDYTFKSGRSYDNERRRIESYLGDILYFRREEDGKKIFLTADISSLLQNPFYKSFKAKSFTRNDINLHFALLYMLEKYGELDLTELVARIQSEIFDFFEEGGEIDVATVRNKLKEYGEAGLIETRKEKGKMYYRVSPEIPFPEEGNFAEAIEFFSENFPVGVIGSYLLDGLNRKNLYFTSKHKYPAEAVDSEIACSLLCAAREHKRAKLKVYSYRKHGITEYDVLPLKLAIAAQSGRNYMMCYSFKAKDVISLRLDFIKEAEFSAQPCDNFDAYREILEEKLKTLWGISLSSSQKVKTLKVDIAIGKDEEYILHRLLCEKRNATLERKDFGNGNNGNSGLSGGNNGLNESGNDGINNGIKNGIKNELAGGREETTWTLTVKTYDLSEVTPWLRTFIGRIRKMEASDKNYVCRFMRDIEEMKKMYGVDGSENGSGNGSDSGGSDGDNGSDSGSYSGGAEDKKADNKKAEDKNQKDKNQEGGGEE